MSGTTEVAPKTRPWGVARRWLGGWVRPLLILAFCVVAVVLLQRLSVALNYHMVIHALRALPASSLMLAIGATAVSFLGLIARDALALREAGVRARPWVLALGAIAGSALGNVVGFGALTGGAVRLRVYNVDGIPPSVVARVSLVTATTFGLALVLFGGLGLLLAAPGLAAASGIAAPILMWLGALGILMVVGLTALGGGRTLFRTRRFAISLPRPSHVAAQILCVALDVLGAALALWVLLPANHVPFGTYLAAYSAALLLGVAGHTPGGVGVFDAAMLVLIGPNVPPDVTVAALLAYRGVYFGLPLVLSAGLLALFEARDALRPLGSVRAAAPRLAPLFLAVLTFVAGAVLVVSGATPAFYYRLDALGIVVPLWVIEAASLFSSVTGVFLMVIARSLFQRRDGAWWLAVVLVPLAAVGSLAKGLAFVEAGLLVALFIMLLSARRSFTRPASLLQQPVTLVWIAALGGVLAIGFWAFFFAFRDHPWSNELLWEVALDDRAPRALRATLAAAISGFAIVLWQVLRPAAGRVTPPSRDDLEHAASIVRAQERSDAVLAMMGDKSFLFSADRTAFLMYAKRGRSWVALYDPVGPRAAWRELISAFVDLAATHGGRAAFYQVRAESLPLYLDAGLKLMKLGEEARVDLKDFGLEGSRRTHLRYALRRGERDGLTAEMISPDGIAAALPMLRTISDAWLEHHKAREKRFSVAAFAPEYLAPQSVMLVRQNGRPVAFTSFMTTAMNTEATVGVMRHMPDASAYAMEFLFTRLALHLKEAGFASLSLGMAPLSGIAPTSLASYWHRVGHLVWRFGGRLYNFQGLRAFKSKFGPVWEPRYLAASGTVGPFLSLADAAVLSGAGPV